MKILQYIQETLRLSDTRLSTHTYPLRRNSLASSGVVLLTKPVESFSESELQKIKDKLDKGYQLRMSGHLSRKKYDCNCCCHSCHKTK